MIQRGNRECLFYAALEFRLGIETRIKEYLEAQDHIAEGKKRGWRVANLARNMDQAFKCRESIVQVSVFDQEKKKQLSVHYFTPVSRDLEKKVGPLGRYLHVDAKPLVRDDSWWCDFKALLDTVDRTLKISVSGDLLGPPLLNRNTNEVHMNVTATKSDVQHALRTDMVLGRACVLKVDYLSEEEFLSNKSR